MSVTQLDAPPYLVEQRALGDRYLRWVMLGLAGYALLGKGFAYIGFAPIYIGEATLAFGLTALVLGRSLSILPRLPVVPLVLMMMSWGALRTLPYISSYGMDALRDGVLWGYGLFALITAGLLVSFPDRLRALLLGYRRFAILFLSVVWLLFLIKRFGLMPRWPGAPVALGVGKGGDIMVHLAGVTAFMLVGMMRPNLVRYLLIGVTFILAGTINRGGMVAFMMAMLVLFILHPPQFKVGGLVYGVLVVLMLVGIAAPSITLKGRNVSVEQVWLNAKSIVSDDDVGTLDDTKDWRLEWWGKIIGYTFGGEYFWSGKGFGVSLAEVDGYQSSKAKRGITVNRDPHNGHLNMLARAGVPGFALWLVMQMSWVTYLLQSFFRSKRAADASWQGIFAFLITYWVAFMVNAMFDVFLEGPMGGIWFWTLFGVGIAAVQIYRHYPEIAWR